MINDKADEAKSADKEAKSADKEAKSADKEAKSADKEVESADKKAGNADNMPEQYKKIMMYIKKNGKINSRQAESVLNVGQEVQSKGQSVMRSEGGHRISREGASLSPRLGFEKVFLVSGPHSAVISCQLQIS